MKKASLYKLRILIADDSEELRERLSALISTHDHALVTRVADSAESAIAMANRREVDVAVLDIEMPGSGIQALKKIKENDPDIHVVMLTNHAEPYFRKICLRAGADYFLDKSMEFEQLLDILSELAGEALH